MTLQRRDLKVEGYERVVEAIDEERGLHAIIAIHNTRLGPALGGTRIYPYHSQEDALRDVLRLSEGMTFKAAVSGVSTGGGKSVIIANPKTEKTDDLLEAFGEFVESFEGQYICAEDVGSTVQDMSVVHRKTHHVVGLPGAGKTGDPSRFTAYGVYSSILATAYHLWGTTDLSGKTVAIQGLGHVGSKLADYLFWAGASLIVCDLDAQHADAISRLYDAQVVDPADILSVPCDILAPCAMGGILSERTIPELKCRAVVGAANNQLLEIEDAHRLQGKGILYGPDFLVNAGGLITVCEELTPAGCSAASARNKVHAIYDTLLEIYRLAESKGISPDEAAHQVAYSRIGTAPAAIPAV